MGLRISRRKNEAVKIGDVWVAVYETKKGRVYLDIEAPDTTHILRAELVDDVGQIPPSTRRVMDGGDK